MKYSNYNFSFYQNDLEQVALYNSRTNALTLLDKAEFEIFKDLNFYDDENSLFKELYEMGYIVEDDFDELIDIGNDLMNARNSKKTLNLTISPTIQCNFRCTYCYEKNNLKSSYMNNQIMNSIIKLVESKIKEIDNLYICWYGGEPLLAFNTVEKLSKKFISLCDDNNVNYSAFMVTNGYLLDENIANKLNDCRIYNLQITIDGNEEYHNSKRFLINGEGTYRKIINNIKNNIDILNNLNLRINVDKNNYDSNNELLSELSTFDKYNKIHPYLGKIRATENVYSNVNCLTDVDFSNIELDFYKKLGDDELLLKYTTKINNFCSADHINSFIINYNGDVYKCWSDVGNKEHCIGTLNTDGEIVFQNSKLFNDYLLFEPEFNINCKICSYLPICMGGCPLERIKGGKPVCTDYKNNLSKYIREMVQILK